MRNHVRPFRRGLPVALAVAVLACAIGVGVVPGRRDVPPASKYCTNPAAWPFMSISCHAYEANSHYLVAAPEELARSLPVSVADAESVVLSWEPGHHVFETRLVFRLIRGPDGVWRRSTHPDWAVLTDLPEGISISSANLYLTELSRLRAPGDTRPITDEDRARVEAEVDRQLAEFHAGLLEYQFNFVDAYSGRVAERFQWAVPRPSPGPGSR